jgi:hypothetical protein
MLTVWPCVIQLATCGTMKGCASLETRSRSWKVLWRCQFVCFASLMRFSTYCRRVALWMTRNAEPKEPLPICSRIS